MGGTKFLRLFHSLSKAELTSLGKYLRANHAGQKIALELFRHLVKSHPVNGGKKRWDDQQLAEKAFGREVSSKELHNIFHDLYYHLREFLVLQKMNDGSLESEWLWLSVLRKRDKEGYGKAMSQFCTKTTASPKKNVMDCLVDVSLRYFEYDEQKRPNDTMLTGLSRSLDSSYMVCRSKIDCEIMNWELQRGPMEASAKYPQQPETTMPLEIYQRIRLLFETNDDLLFQAVLNELYQLPTKVIPRELKAVWTLIKNYCLSQIRNGNAKFARQAHELDKFADGQSFFLEEGESMTPLQFLNIIAAALLIDAFTWASDFAAKSLQLLDTANQHEVGILAEGMILFKKRKFNEARHILENFDETWTRDDGVSIRRRAYILMCQYETNEDYVHLEKNMNSFYSFLQRSNTPRQEMARGGKKFLQFLNHLLNKKRPKKILEEEIKAANPCAFKNWLLLKAKDYSPI